LLLAPGSSTVLSAVQGIVVSIGSSLTDLMVVVAGGIHLAARPDRYGRGVLGLVAASQRALAGVPSADALGLVAGLQDVVPIAGPLIAAVPGC
jgi:predicted PurR-regulated permease PerM